MSSAENDLTQSLLAECRRKDELIIAYKEKINTLEELIVLYQNKINLQVQMIEEYKNAIDKITKVVK